MTVNVRPSKSGCEPSIMVGSSIMSYVVYARWRVVGVVR
jgi:hypothetical protein